MINDGAQLFHRGVALGTLTAYNYETPWASAQLIAADPQILARYAAICAFLAWVETLPDDLPDTESDQQYVRELAAHGLKEDDLRGIWQGWQVHMPDAALRTIWVIDINAAGWVIWRW